LSRELPITKEESKNLIFGIFTITLLIWFYDIFNEILRSAFSSGYYQIKDLIPLVFGGIIAIIIINTFFDLNLLKFKKDDKLYFSDSDLKKIQEKLEL